MSAVAGRPWTATADGVVLEVRLTPKGGRDALDGIALLADGRAVLKARVRAPPHEGEANAALCRLIADRLRVAPGYVTLIGGATGRLKRVKIAGESATIIAGLEKIVGAG